MRWQELFADLEGQARSLERSEHEGEVAERTRAEVGQISLIDRLRAQAARQVSLRVSGVGEVTGTLRRVGRDWLLLSCPEDTIVPLAAVGLVVDLSPDAVSPEGAGAVASRVGLTAVLRAVARDRSLVLITLRDGSRVTGTPDRVGLDCVDLAVHEREATPRLSDVRSRVTVAFAAVAVIRRTESHWT